MTASNKNKHAPVEPFVRRHRPFFVALFVLIPTLAVPLMLYFTVIKSDTFQKWHTLHVVYENSQGLKKGNQVSMSGIAVGHINNVELVKEKVVQVDFNINNRYIHLVKKDTRARMKQRGFVGDWEIELYGGSADAALAAHGDTLGAERLTSMDEIIEAAVVVFDTALVLLSDLTSLIRELDDGVGTVGQLLKNDTLFKQVAQIGGNAVAITSTARAITDDARSLVPEVRKIMGDARGTIRNVDTLLTTVTGISTAVTASGLTLMDTLQTLLNSVNRSFAEIDAILGNLKTVSADAPDLMDRLKDDLEEVELLMQSLQQNPIFRRAVGGGGQRNPSLMEAP